jgi:hypothetical protein
VSRYARQLLHRCRSDAEAFALQVLDDAGIALPKVNAIVAGEEADLSWPIDRISSDVLFAEPHKLAVLATLDSVHRA